MNENGEERRSETFLGLTKFQFTLTTLIVAVVCVFVSLLTFAYSVTANSDRIAEGARRDARIEQVAQTAATAAEKVNDLAESNQAVNCAERDQLQKDIVRTADILIENQGNMIFGIPRELIEQGLTEDRKQRDIFDKYIDCTEVQ